jgi:hypothetical protein
MRRGLDALLVLCEKSVGLSWRPRLWGLGEPRYFRRTERSWSGLRARLGDLRRFDLAGSAVPLDRRGGDGERPEDILE